MGKRAKHRAGSTAWLRVFIITWFDIVKLFPGITKHILRIGIGSCAGKYKRGAFGNM
jgi:hypothetical protein